MIGSTESGSIVMAERDSGCAWELRVRSVRRPRCPQLLRHKEKGARSYSTMHKVCLGEQTTPLPPTPRLELQLPQTIISTA